MKATLGVSAAAARQRRLQYAPAFTGVIGAVLLLALTGCVSHDASTVAALNALRAGNDQAALAWGQKLKNSTYSKDLGSLETGRVLMLGGDFNGSVPELAAAIDTVIEQSDEGPRVKLGDVGANVMAGTITDDRTRPYRLPPYEFIHALEYQMLNRILLGDLEGAGVEARRAVMAQDEVAEKYGADVSASAGSLPEDKQAGMDKVETEMATLNAVADLARSSYENALAWWLCGIIFERERDTANARLAYQKAHELAPGNPFIERDWLLALRTEDPEAFRAATAQTGVEAATLVRPQTELVVIVEQGFVPQRLSKKIPIPVMSAVVSIDFPFYEAPAYTAVAPDLSAAGTGALGGAAQALNVQALAYRDLKEKMPGVVTRNITRAAVRVGAAVAAKEAARHDSTGIGSVVHLGVLAGTALATAINRADTRSWHTLPLATHVWRGAIEPGECTLELRNPLTGLVARVPVKIAAGERRLLWLADTGGNLRAAHGSLNGTGAPAEFGIHNSILGAPTGMR